MQITTDAVRRPQQYFLKTGLPPRRPPERLSLEAERARLQEREHLARELHDVLNGELVAARLQLACLRTRLSGQSEDVDRRLQDLDERLRAALALKDRIIGGLEPEGLRGVGLAQSLRAMAREFEEGSGVHVDTDVADVAADDATRLAIYRLVQESLSNMAKYAGASRASIAVRSDGGQIDVVVRDDGHGFDVAAPRGTAGRGLKGMRQRIEAAGGRLSIDAVPGKGTRIAASLPARTGARAN